MLGMFLIIDKKNPTLVTLKNIVGYFAVNGPILK